MGSIGRRLLYKLLRMAVRPVSTWRAASRRRAVGLDAPITRSAFLAALPATDILEIGPFNNPSVRGPGISYFDVLTSDELRRRADAIGYDLANIPTIDYVSPIGDLRIVDRSFKAVVSSHVVEHQADLIRHLNDVAALLAASGRYFIIVPDKRFCFDHFLSKSTQEEVENAHRVARRVHTRQAVMDHALCRTHNGPLRHWLGVHGSVSPTAADHATAERDAAKADRGDYVDVHAWAFTPASFRAIIAALAQSGQIGLEPVAVHDTGFPDQEFFCVLRPARGPSATWRDGPDPQEGIE